MQPYYEARFKVATNGTFVCETGDLRELRLITEQMFARVKILLISTIQPDLHTMCYGLVLSFFSFQNTNLNK